MVGRIFFPFFPISSLLHLCSVQFFSSDKRLQEIFFQNHLPLPPQELNGRPLIKLSYNTSSVEAVYSQVFFLLYENSETAIKRTPSGPSQVSAQ